MKQSEKKLRKIWVDMIRKCYDPTHPEYKNFGAKGITVCPEWADSESIELAKQGKLK